MPSRGVLPGQHGVIGRVAEDQVAAARLGGKAVADVVWPDLRTRWVEVIRQAATSHRLADVERGAAAGHGVDDQGAGGRVVVQGMGDDGRRDRAGMGDAEGPVVPERPDVVRRGAEIGAEAIAAAQVLVSGMDRLGPGVELGDAAPGPGVARPGQPPDGAGLAVEVLAPHAELLGDRRVGAAPIVRRCGSSSPHPSNRVVSDRRNSDTRRRRSTRRVAATPGGGWPAAARSASARQSSSRASASRIS